MRVLVACEFSGTVRNAFLARGHDAISCDLLPTESPGPHYQGDVRDLLVEKWDLVIAHPPCTFLTVAGNRWFKPEYASRFPNRVEHREEALNFVRLLFSINTPRLCIENPISVISTRIRKPDQIIQPYQFGHPDRKPTCLWLKGLKPLVGTELVTPNIRRNRNGKTASVHHDAAFSLPANERWKVRSKTYPGIAAAMANQWG